MNPEIEFREGLEELASHYLEVLKLLGEDPDREGLQKTPMRVAKAMQVLTRGYLQDPHQVLMDALFAEKYNQMVIVKDIDVFSLCEHHMLPFYGITFCERVWTSPRSGLWRSSTRTRRASYARRRRLCRPSAVLREMSMAMW